MDKHTFYSQICESAGLDTVREHYGLVHSAKLESNVGGLELFQRVWEATKGLIGQFGIMVDKPTIETLKAAMNLALDKVFEIVDWPIVPDAPIDAILRHLANKWFDDAVIKFNLGS